MSVAEKFKNLGYDLLDLESLIYLGLNPDHPPIDCTPQGCEYGCSPCCIQCKNGGA